MKKLFTVKLMQKPTLLAQILPKASDERIQSLTKLTARLVGKMLDEKVLPPQQPGAKTNEL
jgi:hypothetical protein